MCVYSLTGTIAKTSPYPALPRHYAHAVLCMQPPQDPARSIRDDSVAAVPYEYAPDDIYRRV